MKTVWQGRYLDGKTSASRTAHIFLLESGLQVSLEDGGKFLWPYGEIRQAQGSYAGEPVRIERGGEFAEALIIDDVEFLSSLREQVPRPLIRFHNPGFRRTRAWLTFYAGIAALVIGLAMYRWGIPFLADFVTPFVPVKWEVGLGESHLKLLAPPENRVRDPRLDRAINKIMARLSGTLKDSDYRFRVVVCNQPVVNALALPGGTILVYRGLLEETRNAEELAGVLAHEMQHILKRHIMKKIIQESSTGLLISALSGDVTGSMAFGMKSMRTLALLKYSRTEEEEADREGMKMIRTAGINPQGMIRFFAVLKKQGKTPDYLKYVSTHPNTDDRIKMLKNLVATGKTKMKVMALLPETDWAGLVKTLRHSK